jgi:hypothetical protein
VVLEGFILGKFVHLLAQQGFELSTKPVARWPVARTVNEGQIQLPGCSHGRHVFFLFSVFRRLE